MPSPLKADPSRTTTLRRKFAQALRARFDRLKTAINRLLIQWDSFGLTQNEDLTPQRWQFLSSDQQLARFEAWIATQTDAINQDDLWEQYIQESYQKGQGRAWQDAMAARLATTQDAGFMAGTRAQFLASAFNNPPSVEKVKLLAARVYSDLAGITEAMASQVKRELVDGLIQGDNPRDIARRINDRIDKIGKTRAEVLAQTEVMRAHAEGQLDAFERLGVADIGVAVEWSTAGDDRVCPICQPLEGTVFSIQESRGILPRHPRCRCVFLPANVGEPTKGQKRSQGAVKRSIDRSIRAEIPKTSKRTLAQQKMKTKWVGADKRIAKARPKPFSEEVK